MFSINRVRDTKRRNAIRQAVETLESRVLLAYSLDPSFGGDGIVDGQGGFAVAVQSDNKVVAIDPNMESPGIRRFTTNGAPDSTFGTNGRVVTPFAVSDLVISGGKIVVAGPNFQVARYNSNGTLDTTFGGGDGIGEAPVPRHDSRSVEDLALAPDGKLVVVGSGLDTPELAIPSDDVPYETIVRYNADGTPDNSFSGDGVIDEPIFDAHHGGLEFAGVQSNGKIILARLQSFSSMDGADWTMYRLNADGSGDSTFNSQMWHVGSFTPVQISDLDIQSDDKIVLANAGHVERYNANGTVDAAFNTNGLGLNENDHVTAIGPVAGGNILVTGYLDQGAGGFVGRVLSDGNIDATFANGGTVSLGQAFITPQDIHSDSQNRVIVGGQYAVASGPIGFVARLANIPQSPFKGSPFQVGQTIQAEDFDTGGEGVAYHDTDAKNIGAYYRTSEGVDIERTGDVGGGYNVGWANAGEWLEYTINIPSFGKYDIDTRVAAPKSGGTFHYELDGRQTGGAIIIPNTGSYQTYRTVASSLGDVSAGTHILRLVVNPSPVSGPVANFNWLMVKSTSPDSQPPSAVPNFHTTHVGTDHIDVAWDAATDNVGVAGYVVSFDGGIGQTLGPEARSYSFGGPQPGTYTVEISAFDQARNFGPISRLNITVTDGGGGTGAGLKGEYFNNMDFTAPVLTRTDANINFNWGTGSPAPGIDADTFSVRWTGQIQVPTSGRYTFYTTTDDGVRLTVNGQRLIDKLVPQAATEWSGSIDLVAGQKYNISMEYFERFGGAQAKLQWSGPGIAKQVVPASAFSGGASSGDTQAPTAVNDFFVHTLDDTSIQVQWGAAGDNVGVAGYELHLDNGNWFSVGPDMRGWTFINLQPNSTHTAYVRAFDAAGNRGPTSSVIATTTGDVSTGNGLKGDYFNNMDFTAPVFSRTDGKIDFNWGTGSPDSRIAPDSFSVRWTGQILAPATGRYTFYTTTDDGVRLTVNGQRIIDKLVPQAATEWSGGIDLVAGQKYSITLEYFERAGGALARLQWAGPGISKQLVPQSQLFS